MKIIRKIVIALIIVVLGALYSYGTWPQELYDTNVDSTTYANIGAMTADRTFEQPFQCKYSGLNRIDVQLSNLGQKCTGTYTWELIDVESNEAAAQGSIDPGLIDVSAKYELPFGTIEDSADREYIFRITAEEVTSEYGMTIMVTEGATQVNEASVDGTGIDQAGVITLENKRFNVETFIVFEGLMLYLVFFTKFLLQLFK